ncbi:MAG TPA: hypothetical protein VKQ28_14635 [Candidatus Acidoferrum sp.]|nr:hypothetical protein [Candidatus Acidoferrum sp.]
MSGRRRFDGKPAQPTGLGKVAADRRGYKRKWARRRRGDAAFRDRERAREREIERHRPSRQQSGQKCASSAATARKPLVKKERTRRPLARTAKEAPTTEVAVAQPAAPIATAPAKADADAPGNRVRFILLDAQISSGGLAELTKSVVEALRK